ncbi:hypothetical protein JCM9279_003838 [Rhodotorula babjevae]
MDWATRYPLSFSIDPGRPISSYFPLASTSSSSSSRPPSNTVTQGQPPPSHSPRRATSPKVLADTVQVDHLSRSAPSKRPSSSPDQVRDDKATDPRKRPRVRPDVDAVGAATTLGSAQDHTEPRRDLGGDGDGRASRSSTAPDPELALPDEFSPGALKPKLSGLHFSYYAPYLRNEPIAPAWSSIFCETFIAFAMSASPPHLWSGRPDRLRVDDDSPSILREIRSCAPNQDVFRRRAPLNRSRAAERAGPDLMAKLVAMLDVMRWIWDDDSLSLAHVAGMILTAPLAVFMIIRTLAATQRYSILRRIAEGDLTRYLSRHTSPSPREHAALVLLRWFQRADAPPERRYRFFIDRRGRPRRGAGREAGWEAWLAPPGPGGAQRSERELDEWERDVVRREGWPS